MKNLAFRMALITAILTVAISTFIEQRSSAKVNDSMIVSTEWLAKHLNDNDLVLLQVGDKKEYDAAHIGRAQYIQLSDISTPRGQGLTLELPPVEQLQITFQKFGISEKSRIVIYFSKDWVTPTARVYFTLDYLGLGDRTSILDGGLPAWLAEKRPVTAETSNPTVGKITPHPNAKLVVDTAWVKSNLSKPGVAILDARDAKFYTGESAGSFPRAGHIPSAKSIPYSSLVEDSTNKFKSLDALRALFANAGVKPKDAVTTYCHIGQQASLLYFVARYLGYDAHLYDGSFQDWSNRSDLPVEKSP
ncbi:MAG TPA: sulfurtransferase [Pyrinomonadaceae bacterium]|jgi:thiosulfate/3-mercaptopyruvate sulfurtransferase|nr:sulfurtransferase [Pyrinomonadaceae bacterium]